MVLTPPVTRAVVCRVSACPSCPLCGRVSLCAGRDSCDRMCRVRGVSRARSVRRYPRANCYSRGRGPRAVSRASLTVFLPPRSLLYQLFAPRSGRGRSARAGLEPLVSHVPAWAPPGLGAPRCHDRGRHGLEACRSPCYSCALWWAASAHYSIPTLRRRRAETHPFPSFQFERVGSNIERHPNLISNTHQPSTRQASHQAPWSRLNVCASHCVRRSAD